MKGTLHKTERGWVVKYYIMRESSHAIHPNEYTLPLIDNGYIDGLMLYDSNEGLEVEFEIVDFPSNSISKYAKLVSKEYLVNASWITMKGGEGWDKILDKAIEDKATRPLTETDAYRTRLDQLREQAWEEVIREFYRDAQKVPMGAPPLMIECWLAENYNPPTKKQDHE